MQVNRLKQLQNTIHERVTDWVLQKQLRDEWAALNGLKRTKARFSLSAVRDAKHHDGSERDRRSIYSRDIGLDHQWYCKLDGRAFCIVNEPYQIHWEHSSTKFWANEGIRVQSPPNPYASFWYPGSTLFVVITRIDAPDVKWIGDQLDFA